MAPGVITGVGVFVGVCVGNVLVTAGVFVAVAVLGNGVGVWVCAMGVFDGVGVLVESPGVLVAVAVLGNAVGV